MIRLYALVEGQTEETFVNLVLVPALRMKGVLMTPTQITTGRKEIAFKGGISGYKEVKSNLNLLMRYPESWFTTMVDLYALPDDFPGYADCKRRGDPLLRVECLEQRLKDDVAHPRFIPYIQLHEFEALLFSDPSQFERAFPGASPSVIRNLAKVLRRFPTPEHIDDRRPPSKRIQDLLPDFRKTVAGVQIAERIGLAELRRQCAHFNQWIDRIETVAAL